VNKTKQNTLLPRNGEIQLPDGAIYFTGGILMRIFMMCLERYSLF